MLGKGVQIMKMKLDEVSLWGNATDRIKSNQTKIGMILIILSFIFFVLPLGDAIFAFHAEEWYGDGFGVSVRIWFFETEEPPLCLRTFHKQ